MARRKGRSSGMGGGRSRRRNGVLGTIFGIILVLAAILAFVKGTGASSPKEAFEVFKGEAPSVEEFFNNLVSGQDVITWPGGGGGDKGGGDKGSGGGSGDIGDSGVEPDLKSSEASSMLKTISISSGDSVAYDRDEWRHWDNISSCWSTREEVLYRQAESGTVNLLDKNKKPTDNKNNACYVDGGEWIDPFYGDTFTNPSDLDIDHVIPLGYAARHGGQAWNEDKKRDYANSLETGHLLAVSASANRSKGDRGPGEWEPQESYQCSYAIHWISISDSWDLSTTKKDESSLEDMLETC